MKKIGIAILGCGTVGSEVVRLLARDRGPQGRGPQGHQSVELVGIAVRSRGKRRPAHIARRLLTHQAERLIRDPRVGIVVELIGGTTSAWKLQQAALRLGKSVVTANKALLDAKGDQLFRLAFAKGNHLAFEASVGGGIPIIRSLSEGLMANRFSSVSGIINGTTNYILSSMAAGGITFGAALAQAKELGYAEANSSLDIDGLDAAQKLGILIRLTFGSGIASRHIATQGIGDIKPIDIECARRFGFVIKSLAIARKNGSEIEARVAPHMISMHHPLASVDGVMNAIAVHGDAVGTVIFTGQGAGGAPTASAVVADIMSVADRIQGGLSPLSAVRKARVELKDPLKIRSEYYLRIMVTDRPGSLARIAGVLGRHGISISSVYQHGQDLGGKVPIIILTHQALEENMRAALAQIDRLSQVREKTLRIRIEGRLAGAL